MTSFSFLMEGTLALLLPRWWQATQWRPEHVVIRPVAVSGRRWPCSCEEVLSLGWRAQQTLPGVPGADGLLLHAGLLCLSIKELH